MTLSDVLTVLYFVLLAVALFAFGLVTAGRGKDPIRLIGVGLLALTVIETLQLADRTW